MESFEQFTGNRHAGLQAIFVKAVTHPGTRKPGVVLALQLGHLFLRSDGLLIKHRMRVGVRTQNLVRRDGAQRIERDHHRLLERQGLQTVEQVMQTHTG